MNLNSNNYKLFTPTPKLFAKKQGKNQPQEHVRLTQPPKTEFLVKGLTFLGAFWLGFLFLGIALALTGFFHKIFFSLYLIIGAALLLFLCFRHRFNYLSLKIDRSTLFVSAISLIFILFFSYGAEPTVFSGRDQGSFSEAAIRLSQKRRLEFSTPASSEFFKVYGTGKALNFPGFNYTASGNLVTQFPAGYISWLAAWYSFFGLAGFAVANGITLFIFLLSFYFLAKNYLGKSAALAAYFLAATSFLFSWFFKFTLSENLALALVWFGILQFYLFFKNKNILHLTVSLSSFGILLFVRIEAWFFLLMIFFCLVFMLKGQKESLRNCFKPRLILPLSVIGLFYLVTLKVSAPYYTALAKGLLKSFSGNNASFSEIISDPLYSLKLFVIYALVGYLLLSAAAVTHLFRQKKHLTLLPLLVVLPSFFYLIHPGISSDHPWFMRRFIFSVIPAIIFYTVYFLHSGIKKPLLRRILFFLLLAGNLVVFLPFAVFSPNKNLLEKTRQLSVDFQDTDLILIDREASRDGWSMITGPMSALYQKQAVYFFNPQDLEKIDLKKFSAVYFIIPDQSLDFYEKNGIAERLVPRKDYSIETSDLNSTSFELPAKKNILTYGKIYKYQ
ncbi:MAG: hypothetical protein A2259_03575 [Candidatus Moranbacteria bacterium RIFOXYA2_FULL_43_15]|nr:MAG: hypothetical protein A2259_03575 [Candidatus Moranbacteria bacterium RIFOXYA2_FULL_43_15]